MQRSLVLFLMLSCVLVSRAQRHIVVVDLDTHIPIEGVSVKVDSCRPVKTDHNGKAEISELFETVSFSHLKYVPRFEKYDATGSRGYGSQSGLDESNEKES